VTGDVADLLELTPIESTCIIPVSEFFYILYPAPAQCVQAQVACVCAALDFALGWPTRCVR
jgi:hypothetical protein